MQDLRPESFSDEEIQDMVQGILDELPLDIRDAVQDALIHIEDVPSSEMLKGSRISKSILGLYVGTPIPQRHSIGGFSFPPQIYLFRKNIERYGGQRRNLRHALRETLLHEIGHHLGLDEDQLRKIDRW